MGRAIRERRLTAIVGSLLLLATLLIARLASSRTSSQPSPAAAEPPAAASYPEPWWQRYTNAADGYTLALPPDWRVIPLAGDALAAYRQGMDPGQAAVVDNLAKWAHERQGAGWGVWVAIAPDGAPGGGTTLNIIRQPLAKGMSVTQFARASQAALTADAGAPNPATSQRYILSTGLALRTQATVRLAGSGDGGRSLAVTQVYLVSGQNGYVVTIVTRPEQADAYASLFEAVVRSLRWTA